MVQPLLWSHLRFLAGLFTRIFARLWDRIILTQIDMRIIQKKRQDLSPHLPNWNGGDGAPLNGTIWAAIQVLLSSNGSRLLKILLCMIVNFLFLDSILSTGIITIALYKCITGIPSKPLLISYLRSLTQLIWFTQNIVAAVQWAISQTPCVVDAANRPSSAINSNNSVSLSWQSGTNGQKVCSSSSFLLLIDCRCT